MNDIVTYLDGSTGVTEKIKKAMYDAARQFVYIGFLLWEVQEYGYYREKGYKDVYEYAEAELNFKKSSTKNFIAISYEFGCENGLPRGGIAHQRTMNLQQKYECFKYSQLTEMLAMSPGQREQVTPDMTIKQIRELKKSTADELKEDNYIIAEYSIVPEQTQESSSDPGQTSGQDKSNTMLPFIVNNKFLLNKSLQDKFSSVVINNTWFDMNETLLEELIKAAGLKTTKNMCFNIEVKVHKDE